MQLSKPAVTLLAATALLGGSTVAASAATPKSDFRAEALASGLTKAQAAELQHQVDGVLAAHPGGHQVSATKVRFDGVTATVTPRQSANEQSTAALKCKKGHLCLKVKNTHFDFYKCQTWKAKNWTGNGPFFNNQTRGTVAKFYNKDRSVRWTSKAPQRGKASWGPVYYVRPC